MASLLSSSNPDSLTFNEYPLRESIKLLRCDHCDPGVGFCSVPQRQHACPASHPSSCGCACKKDCRPILRWQCCAEAGQHTEDLEQQLARMKQELAGLEHSTSTLQAEAERCEAQLAEQCARADAAERECAQLTDRLAASEAGLSAYQATCAKQVRPSCDCA